MKRWFLQSSARSGGLLNRFNCMMYVYEYKAVTDYYLHSTFCRYQSANQRFELKLHLQSGTQYTFVVLTFATLKATMLSFALLFLAGRADECPRSLHARPALDFLFLSVAIRGNPRQRSYGVP